MDQLNTQAISRIVLRTKPSATATLIPSALAPHITGSVHFYPAADGTLVVAEVFGLPRQIMHDGKLIPAGPFYAFHIHEGSACGDPDDTNPFAASGMHLNPGAQPHPMHMGDMPPLMADRGYAYISFYDARFTPAQVAGHTVVIHQGPDDFRTQPSGGAGNKIACGAIIATEKD